GPHRLPAQASLALVVAHLGRRGTVLARHSHPAPPSLTVSDGLIAPHTAGTSACHARSGQACRAPGASGVRSTGGDWGAAAGGGRVPPSHAWAGDSSWGDLHRRGARRARGAARASSVS